MKRESVQKILAAAQEMTYAEWRMVCEAVEQEFAAIHRAARLTPETAESAQRIIDQRNDWYMPCVPMQEQTALRL